MRKQFKQVPHQALLKAIEIVGGQAEMARQLGEAEKVNVTQSEIHSWANRTGMVPPEYAFTISELTGGRVKIQKLCPDVFTKALLKKLSA